MDRRQLLTSASASGLLLAARPSIVQAQIGRLFAGRASNVLTNQFSGDPNAVFTAIDTSGGIKMSSLGGMTPAMVHVSAANIGGTATVTLPAGGLSAGSAARPYERLEYQWDFGDPSGTELFTDPRNSNMVNANTDQFGPEGFYCYRTPGTYTITLNIRGNAGGGTFISTSVSTTFVVKPFVVTPSFNGYIASGVLNVTLGGADLKVGCKVDGPGVTQTIIQSGAYPTFVTDSGQTVGSIGTPIAMTATNAYYYADAGHGGSDANNGNTPTTPKLTIWSAGPIGAGGAITTPNLALFFANGGTYDPGGSTTGQWILAPYTGCIGLRVSGYSNPSFASVAKPIFLIHTYGGGSSKSGAIQFDPVTEYRDHVYSHVEMQLANTIRSLGSCFNLLRISSSGYNGGSMTMTSVNTAPPNNTITDFITGQQIDLNNCVAFGPVGSNPTPVTQFQGFHGLGITPTQNFTGTVLWADTLSSTTAAFKGSIATAGSPPVCTLTAAAPDGWSGAQWTTFGGTLTAPMVLRDLTSDVKPYTYTVSGSGTSWTLLCVPPIIGMGAGPGGVIRLELPPGATAGLINGSPSSQTFVDTMTLADGSALVPTFTSISIVNDHQVDLVGSTYSYSANPYSYGGRIIGTTNQTVSAQPMIAGKNGVYMTDIYLDNIDFTNKSNETDGFQIVSTQNSPTIPGRNQITLAQPCPFQTGDFLQVTGVGTDVDGGNSSNDITVDDSTHITLSGAIFPPYSMNHGAGGAIYAGIGSLISFNIGGSTTFDDAERGARYGVYGCNVNALSKASIAGIGFSSYKWMAYFATKIQASLLLFGGSSVQNHIINPEPGPQNILIRWVSMDSGGVHPSGYNFCVNARCQNFYNGTATGNSTGGQLCVDACSFADSAQGLGSGNQGNVPPPSNWGHFDGVVFQRNRFTRMQDYAMYTTASLNMTFRDNQLWNVGSLSNLDGLATLSILMYRNRYYRPAGLIPQYGTPSVGSIDNGILYLGGSTLPNAQVQEFTDNLIQDMRDTTTNDNAGILQFPWANHVGKSFFDRNTYYTPTVGTSANTMIDNSTYKTFAAWKADDPNFDPNSVQTNPGWPSPSTGDFGPYF